MDQPLDALLPLASTEVRLADLTEELRQADRKLLAGRRDVESFEARDRAIDATLRDLRTAELRHQEEVRRAEGLRGSARQALERGLGDAAAAERQIARCDEIIDEHETEILQLMENRDALATERAALAGRLAEARDVRETLFARLTPVVERCTAGIAEHEGTRTAQLTALPADLASQYRQIVSRRGTALAPMRDKCCHACGRVVPTMQQKDVRERRLVTCAGCGRWLYEGDAAAS